MSIRNFISKTVGTRRRIFLLPLFYVFLTIVTTIGFDRSSIPPEKCHPRVDSEKIIYQTTAYNCGAAALATLVGLLGKPVSIQQIMMLVETTDIGTTLYELSKGARALGFEAIGMELSFAELQNVGLPLIAHVNSNHFVVVCSLQGNRVCLLDPSQGKREVDVVTFQRMWKGYILLLQPKKK